MVLHLHWFEEPGVDYAIAIFIIESSIFFDLLLKKLHIIQVHPILYQDLYNFLDIHQTVVLTCQKFEGVSFLKLRVVVHFEVEYPHELEKGYSVPVFEESSCYFL